MSEQVFLKRLGTRMDAGTSSDYLSAIPHAPSAPWGVIVAAYSIRAATSFGL